MRRRNKDMEAQQVLMNFEEPLKDYVRYVQSIKATIAERGTAFRQHCELAETTKLKEINIDKLMLTRSEKVGEAEIEYREKDNVSNQREHRKKESQANACTNKASCDALGCMLYKAPSDGKLGDCHIWNLFLALLLTRHLRTFFFLLALQHFNMFYSGMVIVTGSLHIVSSVLASLQH